jgi:hypothetical protein
MRRLEACNVSERLGDTSPAHATARNHKLPKSKTGKMQPTVIGEPLSQDHEEEMEKAARNEEDNYCNLRLPSKCLTC